MLSQLKNERSKMKKTILFDLDGTLIDSTPAILDGFGAAFRAHGATAPKPEAVKALVGHPLDVMFAGLGAPTQLVPDYIAAYKARYEQIFLEQTSLLDGAAGALALASKVADVGVVTTKTSKFSVILLEHLGVMKFIKTVIGRDDVVNPKPDPEPINRALERLGNTNAQDKANAFMIGDTTMDLEAAKRADVAGVGLVCGYGNEADLREHSNLIFKNAFEAVKFIAGR